MKFTHKIGAAVTSLAVTLVSTGHVLAAPPGAQVFDVYDNTQDGLVVGTDPVMGQVEGNANPGGKERIILTVSVKKAAPNCTLNVELVNDSAASNGGLDGTGHTGFVTVLGTLTTNKVGNGTAHFDFNPSGDGVADTQMWGHIDIEDPSGTCLEADGSTVGPNEYGAAPDPLLNTPFTWME